MCVNYVYRYDVEEAIFGFEIWGNNEMDVY